MLMGMRVARLTVIYDCWKNPEVCDAREIKGSARVGEHGFYLFYRLKLGKEEL